MLSFTRTGTPCKGPRTRRPHAPRRARGRRPRHRPATARTAGAQLASRGRPPRRSAPRSDRGGRRWSASRRRLPRGSEIEDRRDFGGGGVGVGRGHGGHLLAWACPWASGTTVPCWGRDLPRRPRRCGWAWLSIAAALTTIGLKSAAYLVTGSVGLLSDALESVVNLVAAVLALVALRIAARPADDTHHFGHGKVEYFSAGAEGLMILVAAVLIIVSAVQRLINPQPLEALGVGLAITLVATVINAVVGGLVLRAGRRHRSSPWSPTASTCSPTSGPRWASSIGVGARGPDGLAAAGLPGRHRGRAQHPVDRMRPRTALDGGADGPRPARRRRGAT